MVDYTLLGFSCGVICGCGTLKLELTKGNNIYSEKFIYVGIPCLDSKDMVKKFRKPGTWKLYKIPMDDRRCYWTGFPMNKFDTKGLPFYTFGKPHKGK